MGYRSPLWQTTAPPSPSHVHTVNISDLWRGWEGIGPSLPYPEPEPERAGTCGRSGGFEFLPTFLIFWVDLSEIWILICKLKCLLWLSLLFHLPWPLYAPSWQSPVLRPHGRVSDQHIPSPPQQAFEWCEFKPQNSSSHIFPFLWIGF